MPPSKISRDADLIARLSSAVNHGINTGVKIITHYYFTVTLSVEEMMSYLSEYVKLQC